MHSSNDEHLFCFYAATLSCIYVGFSRAVIFQNCVLLTYFENNKISAESNETENTDVNIIYQIPQEIAITRHNRECSFSFHNQETLYF